MSQLRLIPFLALAVVAHAQTPVEVAPVVTRQVDRTLRLPGEFLPYQATSLHARVSGFVEKVSVDRGSAVKAGDLLITLSAPEMQAQLSAAESKVAAAEAQKSEAEARLASTQSTYERLKKASETPGAVAGNEVLVSGKSVDAARAAVTAQESAVQSARASVASIKDLLNYLRITAPYDGVITERLVHPGALASPSSGALLELQQLSRLRLVVAVPETEFSGIVHGTRVAFTAPAYPGQTFSGTVARISRAIDPKTRTMPVELEVSNAAGKLAPGMYPEVQWPVRTAKAVLVPATAVVTTTERSFVIRVRDNKAEWVNVAKGAPSGDLVQVVGALNAGDQVVKRGTDEIRDGAHVTPQKR